MRQAERTEKTYRKILLSAIEEFGRNGYDNTSINIICSKYEISKGLIYHNFKNKDELYLCSVKECFEKLVIYLKNTELKDTEFSEVSCYENIKRLLLLRQKFFEEYESYRNVFLGAILNPPKHLIKEVQIIRKEYDDFNVDRFKELLKCLKLRKGVTEEMAITYFLAYQEMFNCYFQNKIYKSNDLSVVGKEHDLKLLSILDVMLYGIALEENKSDKD